MPECLSSEIQLIDDLKKVADALKQIRRMKGAADSSKWRKLDFVLDWHSLSLEDKHRYLSEYGSHEFHLFLKMKDIEYFNGTVRGILMNKMEKKLFDLYLLDRDEEMIARYGKPHLVGSLCAFERCLLIEALVRHGIASKNDALVK